MVQILYQKLLVLVNKYIVLMTACIKPDANLNSKPGNLVARIDSCLRIEDYRSALTFWLNCSDPRIAGIVFCDNSAYPLSELEAFANRINRNKIPLEFIEASKCNWPDHVHYGYCELKIIEEALSRSFLLKKTDYFVKATGRLSFLNFSRHLTQAEELGKIDFLVDAQDYKIPFFHRRASVNTQFMIFRRAFYEEKLIDSYKRMSPWIISHIEDLFFKELMIYKRQPGAFFRFKEVIVIKGIGATTNKNYFSLKQRVRNNIKNLLRKFIPWFWI